MSNINIQHDAIGKLFFAKVKGGMAELHYERHGDKYLDFISTTVPEASRSFGIGTSLVEEGLKFAGKQQLKVKPTCSFVKQYLEEHPEFEKLVLQ